MPAEKTPDPAGARVGPTIGRRVIARHRRRDGGCGRWARLRLLGLSALIAAAAGLVTGVGWWAEPTADLAALLVHVGVLAVGIAGLLDAASLPRGRRSGLGLTLMATSMLVLYGAPGWHLGPLATWGFLASFLPGIWLVAGPPDHHPLALWLRLISRPNPVHDRR